MEKICKNCEHNELINFGEEFETYCYNPDCDIEFSEDEECDNYMGVVEDNDTCRMFKEKVAI